MTAGDLRGSADQETSGRGRITFGAREALRFSAEVAECSRDDHLEVIKSIISPTAGMTLCANVAGHCE